MQVKQNENILTNTDSDKKAEKTHKKLPTSSEETKEVMMQICSDRQRHISICLMNS